MQGKGFYGFSKKYGDIWYRRSYLLHITEKLNSYKAKFKWINIEKFFWIHQRDTRPQQLMSISVGSKRIRVTTERNEMDVLVNDPEES